MRLLRGSRRGGGIYDFFFLLFGMEFGGKRMMFFSGRGFITAIKAQLESEWLLLTFFLEYMCIYRSSIHLSMIFMIYFIPFHPCIYPSIHHQKVQKREETKKNIIKPSLPPAPPPPFSDPSPTQPHHPPNPPRHVSSAAPSKVAAQKHASSTSSPECPR